MEEKNRREKLASMRSRSHMPNSVFYEKVVPILLALMGVLMLGMVLVAAAILLGVIRF